MIEMHIKMHDNGAVEFNHPEMPQAFLLLAMAHEMLIRQALPNPNVETGQIIIPRLAGIAQ